MSATSEISEIHRAAVAVTKEERLVRVMAANGHCEAGARKSLLEQYYDPQDPHWVEKAAVSLGHGEAILIAEKKEFESALMENGHSKSSAQKFVRENPCFDPNKPSEVKEFIDIELT